MTANYFCWFEYVGDVAKAKAFFGEVFNWGTKAMPIPGGHEYTMIALGDDTQGGYLPPSVLPRAGWLSHLLVDDARATAKKIVAAGGKIVKEPVDMGVGTYVLAADPEGGHFCLWQPQKPEAGEYKNKVGAFVWNELYAKDPEASVKFYSSFTDLVDKPMDMGPGGVYHVLESDGKGRGGVMRLPMPEAPHMWVPYVQVADVDATVAKAKRLGADVKMDANDIPNVGRIALFLDPQHVPIGVLKPAPGM
jgi:predicted enzyme related to lactoylglutathione lyase